LAPMLVRVLASKKKQDKTKRSKLVERRRTKSQMLTVFTITTNGRPCLYLLGLGQDNARHDMTRQGEDKTR
jgi:hypothetical protein